jgi:hypothetical protein
MKTNRSIHKIVIGGTHSDIAIFRNNGRVHTYTMTAARIERLSRHPKYAVSAAGALGMGFLAYIYPGTRN